ncbi:DUF445 domain-containing protein [Desulfonatronovibrio hydrogenovorans]|uniref:DUF445 domain-containing protein n=1 Tax=Desulfonatronovibrio hydrogenovorans TaxID=53245 RepID=UPI0004915DAC|nr:DUF445 family protein [Desulfonatronovibrio hydrogenovorans]
MEYAKYLIAPLICALIGWLTNYLAVKMLFHPRRPVSILGWKLQGVFPKRQKELALNLGLLVEKELISHQDIQQVINNPGFRNGFKEILDEYFQEFLSRKTHSLHPVLGMLLNNSVLSALKSLMSREMEKHLPEIMEKIADQLEQSLDFKEVVQKKVEQFSMEKLERILFTIMKKEFRYIEIMGAVLGFAIGIFQSFFIFMI